MKPWKGWGTGLLSLVPMPASIMEPRLPLRMVAAHERHA
jgi:hypothetical protein